MFVKINFSLSHSFRRQVVARSYVGCIKNVEIARTNFDLLKEAYGVKKGCILKVRSQLEQRDAFRVGVLHCQLRFISWLLLGMGWVMN